MRERGIRETRSVCPVCLRSLPAVLVQKDDSVFLERVCPEHGKFSGLIWKGEPFLSSWQRPKSRAAGVKRETESRQGCPHDCGRCPEHGQYACTVLFEITQACNLHCPVCFAAAGKKPGTFPPLSLLKEQLAWISEHAGSVVLQISGGEPTLHPDLPELARAGRALFPAVQLNTNGLLLAEKPDLAHALAEAGVSWVFLQFDGTNDTIFRALRGRPLLDAKLAAVENCKRAGLSVVLVPTVAAGINDDDLGNILRLALSFAPAVRGIHLQPMTRSGRNDLPGGAPLTLPEILQKICSQSGGLIQPEHASPPGCEHERCSFHCRYRLTPSGSLVPLRGEAPCCQTPVDAPASCCPDRPHGQDDLGGAGRAIDVILKAWQGPGDTNPPREEPVDAFDAFIAESRNRTFSVTCMAFQEAMTLDLERLQGCCVHIFRPPGRLVPFCACNLTALDGTPLHRQAGNS